MGRLISTRRVGKNKEKIIVETEHEPCEVVQLKGEMDGIHIFSENVAKIETKLSRRGQKEATQYFLIPKELRSNLKIRKNVSCQRISARDKEIFVYVVDQAVA